MIDWEPSEAALFMNRDLFVVKRNTTRKLYTAFEDLRLRLKDTGAALQFPIPEEVAAISAKISQGEQYQGFPWVMLDYLRYYKQSDMFGFRVMGWFGHYFSAHVLLGGKYAEGLGQTIINKCSNRQVYFSIHKDPWNHAIEMPDYLPLHTITPEQIESHLKENGYIKLSIKIETTDLRLMEEEVVRFYCSCFG